MLYTNKQNTCKQYLFNPIMKCEQHVPYTHAHAWAYAGLFSPNYDHA